MPMMPLPNSPKEHWEKYYAAMRRMQYVAGLQMRVLAIGIGLSIGLAIALIAIAK
jgi:hypothetical protein